MKILFGFVISSLLLVPCPARAQQTDSPASPQTPSLGWGSSIEVGRSAHAAEDLLRRGKPAEATEAAERAVRSAPQNAKLWFLLGYASRLAGELSRSLEAYEHGLRLEPGNLDGLSGLAQSYQRMGRIDEARHTWAELLRRAPRRDNDLLMAGELELQAGNAAQGIELLARAESLHPSAHAELLLAIAYLKQGQPQRARQLLEEARRRDPRNPEVFRAVANFYRDQHDYPSAIAALKQAPSGSPDVLADLAYTYELAGEPREAASTYARAAELAPTRVALLLSAASAALAAEDLGGARGFLARASALAPEHYRLHALRAQLARAERHPAEAIAEYQASIAHLPSGTPPEGALYPIELRLNLAELYGEGGNAAAAREQLAQAEQQLRSMNLEGPERAEFLRIRASVLLGAGDAAGAERDLLEAQKLLPTSTVIQLQLANLYWRSHRLDSSRSLYEAILKREPDNHLALQALGGLAREQHDPALAERYFLRLAQVDPSSHVAWLSLGDLYTSQMRFDEADKAYEHAWKLAPEEPAVIANAANAAIHAGHIPRAAEWVARAKSSVADDPRVLRERERVLFHQGDYAQSAKLGYRALTQLEDDRNASVYLAYDLYNLGRNEEAMALVSRYSARLPKEADFPLLAGHIHKQRQLLSQAAEDYTEALRRDPRMVEGYVNRGYVLNDLQNPEAAITDFQAALSLAPGNGVAHLGLAFSELQLRHGRPALEEADKAEQVLGPSAAIHLVRASAYRELHELDRAEAEYREALRRSPNDLALTLALADTEFRARSYPAAATTLRSALALSPDDPVVYAQLANVEAAEHHRGPALDYVREAEKLDPNSSAILLNTGNALLTLGEEREAAGRFARALSAPDANRVEARLRIARVYVRQGKHPLAEQQIALAFAESRVGEASPVSAEDFVEAANLFLAMNDFDLARRYFDRARQAGAAPEGVSIGLANTSLAEGRTAQAERELAALGTTPGGESYDQAMALGNLSRQQHKPFAAMTSYARAAQLGGEDDTAERAMREEAADQGLQLGRRFSIATDLLEHPVIDDATILGLDRQIFYNPLTGQLPPPRVLQETLWTTGFRADLGRFPAASGFFQLRNARGVISLPNQALILRANTFDTTWNAGLDPTLRLGPATFQFHAGLQYTLRRDTRSSFEINQNLFRQFAYVSTNSLGNWLAVSAEGYREAGPFTEQNLHSRELGARLQFIVGRPWGRTRLLTGYGVRDLLFRPLIREFYSTTVSGGLEHDFSRDLRVSASAEYIRSWRVQDLNYWIAQALRPAAAVDWQPARDWRVQADFAYSHGEGFRDYDNVQSTLLISYTRPLRRIVRGSFGPVPVEYPLRFSLGLASTNYYNFPGQPRTILRPTVRLTLF